jgi:prepilin-type processing-associated H-X9-DG protein
MTMGDSSAMVDMSVQLPASSNHPGGVNLLMGDGSVRFAKDTTALHVWRGLSTRNGGEILDASAF